MKSLKILKFPLLLFVVLVGLFLVHTFFLEKSGLPKHDNLIVLSYWANGLIAAAIYLTLFVFRNRLKNQIGFLFIAGSLLKFILFFILFYPSYRADGVMQRIEFLAFFVPYLLALLLETFFTLKMLKELD